MFANASCGSAWCSVPRYVKFLTYETLVNIEENLVARIALALGIEGATFGLETANPTEEAEFEEDLYKCETRLDDLEETEFGWIAGGRLQGTNTNNFSCYFLKDNDSVDDTLKLFFELESLGIKDDPCYRKDDQAMNIFKETVQYNNNRYVVELPFRKHWNELSNNISVAKQRFQSLWEGYEEIKPFTLNTKKRFKII
ncbi:DUF1758 domain-containing protein [Trichonephila clavipes]|nr:DUF1758 domain-containing protein [Trichonephila clavipes]